MKNLKVLLIPLDWHRHQSNPELFTDMVNAFQEKCETMIYSGNMQDAINFHPTLIFFQGSMTETDLFLLKCSTGAHIAMWTGDARYLPTKSVMQYREIVDSYFFPFTGTVLKRYEMILGKPCYYIWEPIQDWRFRQPKNLDSGKIVYVGNHYENLPGGEERINVLLYLKKYYTELEVYGNGLPGSRGPISYEQVPELYNNSFIVIGENNYTIDNYFTPRNIGAIGAGTCCIHREFPGIKELFGPDSYIYQNKYELMDFIELLKNYPEFRNKQAFNSYKLAKEKFTYKSWVNQFLNHF